MSTGHFRWLKIEIHLSTSTFAPRTLTLTTRPSAQIIYCIPEKRFCVLDILKFQAYFTNYCTNTRHACTYLNVFLIVNSNMVMKLNNSLMVIFYCCCVQTYSYRMEDDKDFGNHLGTLRSIWNPSIHKRYLLQLTWTNMNRLWKCITADIENKSILSLYLHSIRRNQNLKGTTLIVSYHHKPDQIITKLWRIQFSGETDQKFYIG